MAQGYGCQALVSGKSVCEALPPSMDVGSP
jgi:hypothetical protein